MGLKISEAIEKMQALQAAHGDVEVWYRDVFGDPVAFDRPANDKRSIGADNVAFCPSEPMFDFDGGEIKYPDRVIFS